MYLIFLEFLIWENGSCSHIVMAIVNILCFCLWYAEY